MARRKKVAVEPNTKNVKEDNSLPVIPSGQPNTPQQLEMNLRIEKQVERDGIDMGVLSDGTAFLSGRGVARLCGVSSSVVAEILADWNVDPQKPRIQKIKEILAKQKLIYDSPIILLKTDQGPLHAWPDTVCLAILEYYAFDAQQGNPERARNSYRVLAGKALHDYIYKEVGYDPSYQLPERWRVFHDRLSLTHNSVPVGYFCIFKESADLILHLGQRGLHIDASFVPDISIGLAWGKYWTDNKLDDTYGPRIHFEHNYPAYFPQAKSNPQHPWCYPERALGEFKQWFREQYIGGGKFSNYLKGAVKRKELPASFAQRAIAAYYPGGHSTTA